MVHANGFSVQSTEAPWGVADGRRASMTATPGAISSGAQRRRIRLAGLSVEVRRFPKLQPTQITVRPNAALLVVALEGRGELVNETLLATADSAQALLLARPGASTLVWTPGSEGVILHWSRQRTQVLASRRLDLPVRLGASDAVLPLTLSDRLGPLAAELVDETDDLAVLAEERQRLWAGRLEAVFTTLLVNAPEREAILPVARSIRRAMQHVRGNAEADLDASSLAAVSGVTPRTLREGFRACMGVSLSTFVQDARLARARERLASGHDPRAMSEIARAAGFSSASSFSRAYVRAFEETPSQARARGVRQAETMRKID